VGKDIVVVVNLKAAKIFGLESQAMLLAAGDRASLLTPLLPVPPGTKIK
jgi:methionyl-tRNA synthetase